LPDGPTEQGVARTLGMSRSTLHVALSREGATYRGLLNGTREELARGYLEAGRYTNKEIAFLLGFADATTFSRAFKRWTGATPMRYAASPRAR
jgi:AraC-like DNA-binding protein